MTTEAAMPTEQPEFCTSPCTGLTATDRCQECGHLAALHIGVKHCPVCELVQYNRRAQAATAADRIEVHVTGVVDEHALKQALERIAKGGHGGRYRR